MKISKISVHGLFDRFNHDLVFNPDERITIMIGPNGFGKTMILRILNALFNLSVRRLERMPFEEVTVLFDDCSTLKVIRMSEQGASRKRHDQRTLKLEYSTLTAPLQSFTSGAHISGEDVPFSINAIEDIIPSLDQIGPAEWLHLHTGEALDLDDVIAEYGEQLPLGLSESRSVDPAWLENIRRSIPVRFIDTERLTYSPTYEPYEPRSWRSRQNYPRYSPERTVRRYSNKLAHMVQQKLTEYGTLSQSLDRTFPARLVEEPTTPAPSALDLERKLSEVEERRSSIVDAGLLVQGPEDLSVPVIAAMDESRRGVLAVYAQDALLKLSVFDDLYARVNAFKRIANARLLYKNVTVSTDGLKVTASDDGADINLEMLSSGEQHELVLLYDLLFGTAKNSLIMIDEPELSLHVAWQRQMLSDLQDMAYLSDFHVLLATHSPQIIGDRWDLTVELKGPDER